MADNNTGIPDATEDKPTISDNPIDRMIDIAIEAQDGPAPDKNTETPSGEQTPKEGETTPPAQPKDSDSGTGDNKSQQPTQETSKEQTAHRPQDLVLKGQGPNNTDLVVKGGAERRFYEQRETARQQAAANERLANTANARAEKAESELNTLRTTVQSIQGTDPETIKIGTMIVKDLQRDPVGTMKKLLAETVAQGHTIDGIVAGVDHLAVQRAAELLRDQQPQEPTEAQLLAEAQQEVTTFYGSYPDARPHDALLGRMLRDYPSLNLESAYFQLKNAFIEKGYDWSRSIDDNLANASPQQQPQPQPQPAPMPNGRAPNGMAPADEVKIAHEDTGMDDIVRQSMREAGLMT